MSTPYTLGNTEMHYVWGVDCNCELARCPFPVSQIVTVGIIPWADIIQEIEDKKFE